MDKKTVVKGTVCWFVNENKETNNCSMSMDKDRELSIGDIFVWGEDTKRGGVPHVVVGWIDWMPLIVEVVL